MTHIIRKSSFYIISILCAFSVPVAFVEASGSLTIQSLTPSSGTVSINSPVTFTVAQTGFTSPTFTATDDVGLNLTPNINAFGSFSWTPINRDVGVHNITISATDNAGNSASVSQAITVILPSISLTGMTNGPAAFVGKPMTFQITPVGFTGPTYWLGDSVGGSTLNNSKLSSSGAFYWVPQFSDVGTHKMMINVSDQQGHYAELTQDVTVSPQPKPEVQSLLPGTTTPVGATVSFTVTSPGYTAPTFSVSDSYSPTTVSTDNINASGVFSWVPVRSQTGVHDLRIMVRDSSGQNTLLTQTILVQDAALSIEGGIQGESVTVGSPARFNVRAIGFSSPTFSVSDNYPGGSTITTSNISSSGLFIWTPTMGDLGLHNIAVNATDIYGNFASVRKDIKVVLPVTTAATVVAPTPTPSPVVVATPVTTQAAGQSGAYYFTKSLTIGSSGAEVTALQQILLRLGFFTSTPTGTFGPMTAAAVKRFQASRGLEQVGNVGPGTRAKLNAIGGSASSVTGASVTKSAYQFTVPLALGASGIGVIELQTRLKGLGFYSGVISGTFDAATVVAVKKFQASKGLEQVGSVGPGTRAALNAL